MFTSVDSFLLSYNGTWNFPFFMVPAWSNYSRMITLFFFLDSPNFCCSLIIRPDWWCSLSGDSSLGFKEHAHIGVHISPVWVWPYKAWWIGHIWWSISKYLYLLILKCGSWESPSFGRNASIQTYPIHMYPTMFWLHKMVIKHVDCTF